jgi:hypothetical protein
MHHGVNKPWHRTLQSIALAIVARQSWLDASFVLFGQTTLRALLQFADSPPDEYAGGHARSVRLIFALSSSVAGGQASAAYSGDVGT